MLSLPQGPINGVAERMNHFLLRLIFILSIGSVFEVVNAAPVIALTNLPPPGNFKVGGSSLDTNAWKALLFTTPPTLRAAIVSVQVGLSCSTCAGGNEPYPSVADLQVAIYSVTDQGGVPTPDTELYSIPMQYGLILTGRGTLFTFQIPNWQLVENTTYALVLKSTNANPVKWGNIEVNSTDEPPQAENGFSFVSAFATNSTPSSPWISAGLANNNGFEMQVLLISPVPTLSEWAQIILSVLVMSAIYWFYKKKQSR